MTSGIEAEPLAAAAVFGDRIELARRYVRALAAAGVERGLIGPREAERLWSRHTLNCAVLAPLLPDGCRVVDIGSGAGLPGIPLAIVRPDCRFDLVEPLERRCRFLSEMVADLGLAHCRVVRGRAEQVIDECAGADVVTARAVAPLARLAGWAAPLLRPGGTLLAMKGSSAAEEIDRDADAVSAVGIIELVAVRVGDGIVDPATIVARGQRTTVSARRTSSPRRPGTRGGARGIRRGR